MTGATTLRTTTATITTHTASVLHGTGAATMTHGIGTPGLTAHGDTAAGTTTAGMTHGTMEVTTADTTEATGAYMTHGTTEAGDGTTGTVIITTHTIADGTADGIHTTITATSTDQIMVIIIRQDLHIAPTSRDRDIRQALKEYSRAELHSEEDRA